MSHTHTTADGRKTSAEVVDPEDAGFHWHTVDSERTSVDEFGKGHTHLFQGIKTTGPVDADKEDNSNTEDNPKSLACVQQGKITEHKQIDRNGLPVGIVEGYIATWDIDRGDCFGTKDRFARGAFTESLADLKARNRHIRLKDHHSRTVGIFPISTAFEDDRGLFASGEVNLDVQQGKEAYSLVIQKAITEFSIGFTAEEFHMEDDVRVVTKAIIWEGSLVDEPMNPKAVITSVKKFNAEEVADMTPRQLEKALKANGFSGEAAKIIVKQHKQEEPSTELADSIKNVTKSFKNQELTEIIRQAAKGLA